MASCRSNQRLPLLQVYVDQVNGCLCPKYNASGSGGKSKHTRGSELRRVGESTKAKVMQHAINKGLEGETIVRLPSFERHHAWRRAVIPSLLRALGCAPRCSSSRTILPRLQDAGSMRLRGLGPTSALMHVEVIACIEQQLNTIEQREDGGRALSMGLAPHTLHHIHSISAATRSRHITLADQSPFFDHSSFRSLPSSVAGVGRACRETKNGCVDEQNVFANAPPAVECTSPILRKICSCARWL